MSPAALPDLPRVGGYRLLARIGEGGMGVVHLAEGADGSRVALKVLRQHIIGDRESRQRLAREVASLQLVTSPRVAEVIDADPWGETPFVATRYVPGLSLHEHVRQEGPVSGADLAYLAACLVEALQAVHRAGVLHRDVKPANVLLEGRAPVLIDFGLARLAEDPRLTQTGFLLGTPGYLAPEILYGEDASTASDVHSWAATMVFASTGRPPFGTGPALAVMDRVRRGEHDLSGVPPALLPLVEAGLAPDPARRPSTADLLRALPGPGPRPAPVREAADATMPLAAVPRDEPDATDVLASPGRTATSPVPMRTAPLTPSSRQTAPSTRPMPVVPLQQASRAPYEQPPVPQQRPREVRPEQPQRSGVRWLQRRTLLLGLFATATLVIALAPYLGLAALAVVALGLRTVSWTAESAHHRRYLRGRRRWYDGPLTVLSSPWYLVVATAGTVVLVLWAALVGSVVALVCLLFAGPLVPGLVLIGATTTAAVWWGPASRRLRTPTRRLLGAVTVHPVVGWCAVALVVAGAGLCAYALVTGGVVWDPAPGPPWRSGTLLGGFLRWL